MKFYDELLGREIEVPLPDIAGADAALRGIRLVVMSRIFDNATRDELLARVFEGREALRRPGG